MAPFLEAFAGVESPAEAPAPPGALAVEVELDAELDSLSARRLAPVVDGEGRSVGEVMSVEPLVVAPEDTLGEIAEKMRARDVGSAAVADYGHLIGILTSRDMLHAFAGRAHPSEARARVDDGRARHRLLGRAGRSGGDPDDRVRHPPPAVVEADRPVGMLGLREAARAARRGSSVGLGF